MNLSKFCKWQFLINANGFIKNNSNKDLRIEFVVIISDSKSIP